jgi:hypothetical protein
VAAFRYESGAQVVRFGWASASAALAEEVARLDTRRIFAVCGASGRPRVERLATDHPIGAIMAEAPAHLPG